MVTKRLFNLPAYTVRGAMGCCCVMVGIPKGDPVYSSTPPPPNLHVCGSDFVGSFVKIPYPIGWGQCDKRSNEQADTNLRVSCPAVINLVSLLLVNSQVKAAPSRSLQGWSHAKLTNLLQCSVITLPLLIAHLEALAPQTALPFSKSHSTRPLSSASPRETRYLVEGEKEIAWTLWGWIRGRSIKSSASNH